MSSEENALQPSVTMTESVPTVEEISPTTSSVDVLSTDVVADVVADVIADTSNGADTPSDVCSPADGCHDDTSCNGNTNNCRETVDIKVIYNKQKHDVTFALDDTVLRLKEHIEKLTQVPVAMQKVVFKGRMNDESTLREHKVTSGSKIMVVGSTVTDVLSVSAPSSKAVKDEAKAETASGKEPLSRQKPHKTVLDKYGKPEDLMPGIKRGRQPLPPVPISGMYNKSGGKVRLTFKLEQEQLWIGTKERTEKLPINSIKQIVTEPIEGHEEYHVMGFQLGPTEASRYWVYWVPAQYTDAIKDAILGGWQYF